jgi:hypothetical protein
VTAASLFWTWVLIGAVCTAGCAIAGAVGERVHRAERERSRQQWQHMCEELGAENLDGGYPYEELPTAAAPEAIPTEALR